MNAEAWIALGSLAITLFAVVFQMGRLSQRVDTLDEWRVTTIDDLKAIRSGVDYVTGALRAEKMS